MKIVLVIPARFQSTRLPGKPLVDILGKSMISRVYEQCIKAMPPELVYVATDNDAIMKHCKERNINVVLTSNTCLTGTDRVAEFSKVVEADYFINVQGDEPLIDPEDIIKIKNEIINNEGKILNGYCPIKTEDHFRSVGIPKVTFRNDKRLLYMSRAGIPGNKEIEFSFGYRQVCVYAFPKKALTDFYNYGKKTEFEKEEDIEILRFLEMGYDVQMIELSESTIPVDYPEDVQKVINVLEGK
ncbi:3-deoxy-manno-octulosonate cytidylyltransferase [Polaribacter gochangensis]|uniref:3-deoxy-manno-octulosonate cytidylyltransferase n=1 Tax=Polaribacter gochangensis TaxID=3252903 RepID=UPI0039047CDD